MTELSAQSHLSLAELEHAMLAVHATTNETAEIAEAFRTRSL